MLYRLKSNHDVTLEKGDPLGADVVEIPSAAFDEAFELVPDDNVPHPTEDNIKGFLVAYADALKGFELQRSDFPLGVRVKMAFGIAEIVTRDGRSVAAVGVEGDCVSPSMPLGHATFQYTRLFTELANAWACQNPFAKSDTLTQRRPKP